MAHINETLQAGLDAHRAGRLQEAEALYRRALQSNPRHAPAYHLLGLLAFQVGQLETAAQLMNDAIKLDGFTAMYHADLGEICRAQGKIPEAINAYRKSIKLNSQSAETQTNLGTLLEANGELDEALACFCLAVEVDPKFAAAHRHLGVVLMAGGQLIEAQAALVRAAELKPEEAQCYFDLGYCLQLQGKRLESMPFYHKAIELKPDSGEAHYHFGMARLALGDFRGAWHEFEWRLQPEITKPRFTQPMWDGDDLGGQKILIHADCPLGDVLQFLRYVPLVRQRGGDVTLEVPPPLVPLVQQSGFKQAIATGSPPPPCAVQVSLLSLPRIFITRPDSIPAQIPYLSAAPELVEHWREKLQALNGFKVGIVWQGDPVAIIDRYRSIPLKEFLPVARVPGVQLISLQKKDGLDQLAALGGLFPLADWGAHLDEAHGPFMDTAAIMKNLDLVITCDTAAAHLAGGLGVKAWVALSTAPDWRWMLERDDSPWYPSVRLFRQSRLGDWAEVFQRIATELARLAAGRQRPNAP
jgi:Flp pilus assembly protein TadD